MTGMRHVLLLLAVACGLGGGTTACRADAVPITPPGLTFSSTADFALGEMKSVIAETPDQLVLGAVSETEPLIWIANYKVGTVTKIDTRSGAIVGQYYSSRLPSQVLPDNMPGQIDIPAQGSSLQSPSRTAVDLDGNMFVANRANVQTGCQGSLTKIAGSKAYGIDTNRNGIIDTSSGAGDIRSDDECLLWTVKVGKPNTWVRGVAVDSENNVWASTFGDAVLYRLNGETGELMQTIDMKAETGNSAVQIYGLAVGRDGAIYSTSLDAKWAARIDPKSVAGSRIRLQQTAFQGYGLAVDANGVEWIARWEPGGETNLQMVDWSTTPATVGYRSSPYSGRTRGVAIDGNGFIWAANFDANALLKFSPLGNYIASYGVATGPIGVAVDSLGKIWAVCQTSNTCTRIDPATGVRADFSAGGEPYSYSDMTGFQLRNFAARQGSWAVLCDGGSYSAEWQKVSWNADAPTGTLVKVEVRATESLAGLDIQPWVTASSGSPLSSVKGRYLQVRTTLRVISGSTSPTLYDLTVDAPQPGPEPQAMDIPGAKGVQEGAVVQLDAKTVTYASAGLIYLEETARHSGIGIETPDPVGVGDTATVVGTAGLRDGEWRLLNAAVVSKSAGSPLSRLGMPLVRMGGAAFDGQPQVKDGVGLSNIGLLVRSCGRVTAVGSDYFYIDDGSGAGESSGAPGVKVACGSTASPHVGSYVLVSGISSCYLDGATAQRLLRLTSLQYQEYFNDFEMSAGPEWSTQARQTTPTGARTFLGRQGNGTMSLTLSDLPTHSQVSITFDLFVILSWDGNGPAGGGPDNWQIAITGEASPLLKTNFANYYGQAQAFPDAYGVGSHDGQTGADEVSTLGYNWTDGKPMNSVYYFRGPRTFVVPHTASSITINFTSLQTEGIDNESFGLDNVGVTLQ